MGKSLIVYGRQVIKGVACFVFLAFFQSVTLTTPAISAPAKNWILAVGIIDFADTRIPKLNYCVKDAEALTQYFQESSKDDIDITLLKNEEATKDAILTSLAKIKQSLSPEDTIIFYYSSHGIGDIEGNTYFITFDTNKDDLANTALGMQQIKDIAAGLGSKNIVMLFDTCHSGGAKSLGQQNPKSYDNLMLAANKKTRLAILTSSRTHESSVESPEWGHGVFTYFLLQGMKGKADDYPADGKVSVTELFDYVMIAVPRATERAQHPTSKFSYNWPGSKMDPVNIGYALKVPNSSGEVTPAPQKDASAPKSTSQISDEGWNNVLEPAD